MRMITIAIATTVACLGRISICARAPNLPQTIHVVAIVPAAENIATVRIERLEAGLKAKISSEPAEPANYFELADLYSFAKLDDAEEEALTGAVEAARGQSTYERLTAFYIKRWRTAEASALVTRWEKIDATAKPRISKAMLLWGDAVNAANRSDPRAALDLIEQGLTAADEANSLSHPGDDALLVYGSKSELLKLRAELTKDPTRY